MIYGYVRVSTREQNEARQVDAMKEFGVDRIYMDKQSGKDFNRPCYMEMVEALNEGDVLVLHSIDRLGRVHGMIHGDGGKSMSNDMMEYEGTGIRRIWDEVQEEWYFSIVDVVGVLTEQPDYTRARKYWNKLKQRLNEEGSELVTNCHQLRMRAADGKMRLTDVANTEQLFRLIQSIPSPKAEPFRNAKMYKMQVL